MRITATWRRHLAGACIGLAAFAAAAQDIVVGQIGPFTVLPVPDAEQVNQGIKAHLAQVNAKGGVAGRAVTLFELDDQYAPDVFVQRFAEALERKPVALLSPIGSASLKRMVDDKLLDRSDVVVLNTIPGAEALRTPGHPRLFHVRAGDRQQIQKIVQHARALGIDRMTVLHEDIPVGVSGLAAAKDAAARVGLLKLDAVQSTKDVAAITEAARQVAERRSTSVTVIGSPRFMADAVSQLRKAGVSQTVFTLSYVSAALLTQVAGEAAARGVGIAQTYPNPNGIGTPLQRDFQAAMKAAFPQVNRYTAFHFEGYVTARVLTEALRRTKDITPAGLARSLKDMGEVDFGGYRVNFSKGNAGSNFVDIGVVTTGGKLMY